MNTEARVEHIHIANTRGGPLTALASVKALSGVGLAGDRNATHHDPSAGASAGARSADSCDVTLIEAEAVENLAAVDITLEPGESRRNLTTRGVRLNDLVGKEFWIGEVLARGVELCEPCTHLVALTGKPLIKPLAHRGGLRADLLTSGRIKVGDPIAVKDGGELPSDRAQPGPHIIDHRA
jgi:MOSC domain-containing protein YiiM